MSHIHSLGCQTEASAQYQAYLDRAAAAGLSEEQKAIRKRTQTQSFDSLVDPDGKHGGNPSPEREQEQATDGESGPDESDGFGKRYA